MSTESKYWSNSQEALIYFCTLLSDQCLTKCERDINCMAIVLKWNTSTTFRVVSHSTMYRQLLHSFQVTFNRCSDYTFIINHQKFAHYHSLKTKTSLCLIVVSIAYIVILELEHSNDWAGAASLSFEKRSTDTTIDVYVSWYLDSALYMITCKYLYNSSTTLFLISAPP